MILDLTSLKSFDSLLSIGKETPTCLISIVEKALYINDDNKFIRININLEATEQEIKNDVVLTLNKADLLHLIPYSSKVEIDSNNKYNTDTNIHGIFNSDSSQSYMYESLKELFNNKSEYNYCIENKDQYNQLVVANRFTNAEDKNNQAKFTFIKNNKIFSSSMYRIYINDFIFDNPIEELILPCGLIDLLKYTNYPINISRQENSIYVSSSNIDIIYATVDKVSVLPLFEEKFTSLQKKLFSSNYFTVNVINFISKLDYLRFYAKEVNNKASLTIKDTKVKIEVNNKNCELDMDSFFGEIEFSFNIDLIVSALKIFSWKPEDTITIYENSDLNIFCVVINRIYNEYLYSSKLVNK